MSEPPSPGDTLGTAADAGAPGAAPDASTGPEAAESGPKDILDLLLHTEPDLSPAEIERKMGIGPAPSNAIVGVRKVLHGATGRGGGSGTPAVVNFGAAAYHAVGLDAGGNSGATNQDVSEAFDFDEEL